MMIRNVELAHDSGRVYPVFELEIEAPDHGAGLEAVLDSETVPEKPDSGDVLKVRLKGGKAVLFEFRFASWAFKEIDRRRVVFNGTLLASP